MFLRHMGGALLRPSFFPLHNQDDSMVAHIGCRRLRTIKEPMIKASYYTNFVALKKHILAFVMAYNFAVRDP